MEYLSQVKSKIKDKTHPAVYKPVAAVLGYMKKQWFFIALAVFIALAHSYPNATAHAEISYWAVAIIFFISGISMKTKDLIKNMAHWRAHFTVLTSSFLITSSIIYGICCGIRAAGNDKIDNWMLVGLIVTATCPTTVSSNVVMTRQADGNVLLTLCEVVIGNLLGAFITPALSQMFLSGPWEFANPANGSSVQSVYRSVMMQIGLSVFVPMFVGQVIQNLFLKQVNWCMSTFKLAKVGTFMLALVMWSSFCTAFRQNAFTSVSTASIIMIVFFNIGIYLFFTVLCFCYCRPIFILKIFPTPPTETSTKLYKWGYLIFRPFYYSRRDTISIMLCGPAKTAALGVSLVISQYGSQNENLGKLLVPLVLYQSEQVFCAGLMTPYFKKWIHADPELKKEEERKKAQDLEKTIESTNQNDETQSKDDTSESTANTDNNPNPKI